MFFNYILFKASPTTLWTFNQYSYIFIFINRKMICTICFCYFLIMFRLLFNLLFINCITLLLLSICGMNSWNLIFNILCFINFISSLFYNLLILISLVILIFKLIIVVFILINIIIMILVFLRIIINIWDLVLFEFLRRKYLI